MCGVRCGAVQCGPVQCVFVYVCVATSAAQTSSLLLLKPLLGGSVGSGRNHVVHCRSVNRRVLEDVKEDTFLIRVEVPAVTKTDLNIP